MLSKKLFNVYTSVEPLYVYMKIFGIFLPSFVGKSQNGILSVKTFDKFWFLISLVLVSFLTILIFNKQKNNVFSSLLLANVYDVCAIFGLFAILIVIINQLRIWRAIVTMLKEFYAFDEEVCNFLQIYFFLLIIGKIHRQNH